MGQSMGPSPPYGSIYGFMGPSMGLSSIYESTYGPMGPSMGPPMGLWVHL